MKGIEIIQLSQEESQPLVMAATGSPYFLLVDTEEGFYASIKEGFDVSHIFDWIVRYARDDKEFKDALADFVIDLSKEC